MREAENTKTVLIVEAITTFGKDYNQVIAEADVTKIGSFIEGDSIAESNLPILKRRFLRHFKVNETTNNKPVVETPAVEETPETPVVEDTKPKENFIELDEDTVIEGETFKKGTILQVETPKDAPIVEQAPVDYLYAVQKSKFREDVYIKYTIEDRKVTVAEEKVTLPEDTKDVKEFRFIENGSKEKVGIVLDGVVNEVVKGDK